MSYWEILMADKFFGLYSDDENIALSLSKDGINIARARVVLSERRLMFKVIDEDGNSFLTEDCNVGDVLSLSWIRGFSNKAKKLLKTRGYNDKDFVECELEINKNQPFYLFLPRQSYDLIDYDKSKFAHYIPTPDKKSLPFHLTNLVLNREDDLGCFFAHAPFGNQILPELIVNTEFKEAWEKQNLEGAKFRQI